MASAGVGTGDLHVVGAAHDVDAVARHSLAASITSSRSPAGTPVRIPGDCSSSPALSLT
jgi:hypothetical protein